MNYQVVDGVLFNQEMTTLIYYPAGKLEESYTVPDGVYTICGWAFADATNLKELYLPESVVDVYTKNSNTPSFGCDYEGNATALTIYVDPESYLFEELAETNMMQDEQQPVYVADETETIQQVSQEEESSSFWIVIGTGLMVVCGFLAIRIGRANRALKRRREMVARKKKSKGK